MGKSVNAQCLRINVEEGLERIGITFQNVFAATKDEGAEIAAAIRETEAISVCHAMFMCDYLMSKTSI